MDRGAYSSDGMCREPTIVMIVMGGIGSDGMYSERMVVMLCVGSLQ